MEELFGFVVGFFEAVFGFLEVLSDLDGVWELWPVIPASFWGAGAYAALGGSSGGVPALVGAFCGFVAAVGLYLGWRSNRKAAGRWLWVGALAGSVLMGVHLLHGPAVRS